MAKLEHLPVVKVLGMVDLNAVPSKEMHQTERLVEDIARLTGELLRYINPKTLTKKEREQYEDAKRIILWAKRDRRRKG